MHDFLIEWPLFRSPLVWLRHNNPATHLQYLAAVTGIP